MTKTRPAPSEVEERKVRPSRPLPSRRRRRPLNPLREAARLFSPHRARHREGLRIDPIIVTALFVALAARLWQLGGDSLWIDEIRSTWWAMEDGILAAARARGPLEPPLSYLLQSPFLSLPLPIETAARLPFALLGVVEVAALAWLAFRLTPRDPRVARISALLLAVAPFAVRYAQEARYYTLFSALHLLAWAALVGAIRTGRWRPWLAFAGLAAASLLAHPFALLLVPLQVITGVTFTLRRPDHLVGSVGASLITATLAGAWFWYGIREWRPLDDLWRYGFGPPGRLDVVLDTDLVARGGTWLLSNAPEPTALGVTLAALVFFAPVVAGGKRLLAGALVAYLALWVVAVTIGARMVGSYFAYRRVEFLLPLLLVAAALALTGLADLLGRLPWSSRAGWTSLLAVALVVLTVPATLSYYRSEKTDYREAARLIRQASPEAVVVLGEMDPLWVPAVRDYLAWKGVDRPVLTLDEVGDLDPPLPLLWLTGAAPEEGFTVHPLNDPQHLQVVAGDRSWPSPILPLYVLESRPDDPPKLAAQAEIVSRLPSFVTPP